MPLREQLNEDMKAAMKAREAERLAALRLLLAAVKQREIDERVTLDDAGVIGVVEKMIKQRKDSIAQFEKAARQDLADKEKYEISVIEAYLPKQMSAAGDRDRGGRGARAVGGQVDRGHGQGHGRAQAQARRPRRLGQGLGARQGEARGVIIPA